ncbi:hypothetical protein SZ64_13680 [Erythrobacter sp. SG61-1L]|uniref:hypothetical protein n=1 Tax=Erythrobacter sp. SG61-1L TaxID=1603897 RepID=UPI0006C90649|nr:hypothetical protein [Erythrobacter sp. SG61-1L]KPL69061.1 hypothetical protein SZ64_13680 [Erythrobacter sp. SG61-1L]
MGTTLLVVSFAAVGTIAAGFGVVIGGMLASSKVADLHARLDHSEELAREQAQLLEALRQVVTTLLDELGANGATSESHGIASDLLGRMGTPDAT